MLKKTILALLIGGIGIGVASSYFYEDLTRKWSYNKISMEFTSPTDSWKRNFVSGQTEYDGVTTFYKKFSNGDLKYETPTTLLERTGGNIKYETPTTLYEKKGDEIIYTTPVTTLIIGPDYMKYITPTTEREIKGNSWKYTTPLSEYGN